MPDVLHELLLHCSRQAPDLECCGPKRSASERKLLPRKTLSIELRAQ
jgi:hypothetical protein